MAVAIFFGLSALVVLVSTIYITWAIRGHLLQSLQSKKEGKK